MKHRTVKNKPFPYGVTSILVVVGIAMVFIVMVVGLTALSIRESRQATNTDLSNRALAAARAAAAFASEFLEKYPNMQLPNCDPNNPTNVENVPTGSAETIKQIVQPSQVVPNDNVTYVTCQTITSKGTAIEETVKKDNSSQLFTYLLDTTANTTSSIPKSIKLQWGNINTDTASATLDSYLSTNYGAGKPAALEVSVVSWKTGANQDPKTALSLNSTLIVPSSTPTVKAGSAIIPSGTTPSCTSAQSPYRCVIVLSLDSTSPNPLVPPGNNYIAIQIRPRFADSTFKAEVFPSNDATGNAINVQSSRATIDTTVRVGDLTRRIRSYKTIYTNNYFNDVLYSSQNICKKFKVNADFSVSNPNPCS